MKAVEYDLLSPYREVEQGGEEPDLPSLRVSVGSVVKIALLVLARGGRVRSGEQRLLCLPKRRSVGSHSRWLVWPE